MSIWGRTRWSFVPLLALLLAGGPIVPAAAAAADAKASLPLSYEDRVAIEELLYRYSHYVDNRLGEAWASTFTPDGRLEYFDTVVQGHDALIAFAARPLDRYPTHFVGDIILVQTAPGHVHARSMVTVMVRAKTDKAPTEVLGVGVYDDQIVKTKAGWRFQVRHAGSTGVVPVDPDFLPKSEPVVPSERKPG